MSGSTNGSTGITFTLNGTKRTVAAAIGENLQALLQRMGIPSVRDADGGEGFAGSDTILLDGKPVLAGLMVAGQVEGRSVQTVESLMPGGRLSAIQEAMLDTGVVQSAYNSPAAALLIADLLRRVQQPTEDDVRDALSGLFSRATGYRQFFDAVRLARERLRAAAPGGSTAEAPEAAASEAASAPGARFVGRDLRRVDGVKLVAGMKAYVEDQVEVGSCVLRMLRSPHAHARIRAIDTTAAEAVPGVVLLLTHRNCPDVRYGCAGQGDPEPSPYDRRMFESLLRHHGDRVAAVVAETVEAAEAALALIDVDYEVLDPVLGIDEAMADGAPLVHPEPIEYPLAIGADPRRNLAASAAGVVGDPDQAFLDADVIVERTYTTSRVQCTPLEPHVVYTRMDGDRLVVHASTQVPWHLRRIVARVLGIGESRVRVIKERIGGGYGEQAGHPARGGVRVRHAGDGPPRLPQVHARRGVRRRHGAPPVPGEGEDGRPARRHAHGDPHERRHRHRRVRQPFPDGGDERVLEVAAALQVPQPGVRSQRLVHEPRALGRLPGLRRAAGRLRRAARGRGSGRRARHGPGRVPREEPRARGRRARDHALPRRGPRGRGGEGRHVRPRRGPRTGRRYDGMG